MGRPLAGLVGKTLRTTKILRNLGFAASDALQSESWLGGENPYNSAEYKKDKIDEMNKQIQKLEKSMKP